MEEEAKTGEKEMENVDMADAGNVDEAVFNQGNELIEESVEANFTCTHPQNKSGHIVYKCKGSDKQGLWEGERRYNEFYKLYEKLEARWPGVPLPMLPPKKFSNKDIKFINERRFYLERFLKKLSQYDFILNSQEFTIFSRPSGDICKMLDGIPKGSSGEIVEKYKDILNIQIHLYDPIARDKLDNQCKEF